MEHNLLNFATVLDNLKLTYTAKAFRYEYEKNNTVQKNNVSHLSNPTLLNIIKKLSKNPSSYNQPSIQSQSQSSLLNTKIFKSLYDNFDSLNSNGLISQKESTKNDTKDLLSTPSKSKGKDHQHHIQLLTESKSNDHDDKDEEDSQLNNADDSIFNTDKKPTSTCKQITPNPFSGSYQLDKMLKIQNIRMDKNEESNMDSSSFFQNSHSMILHDDNNNQSMVDEYVDDDDPGFDLYECDREYHEDTSKKLSEQYGFPERAFYKSKFKDLIKPDQPLTTQSNTTTVKSIQKNKDGQTFEIEDKGVSNVSLPKSNLPPDVMFMNSNDSYYPIVCNNVWLDSFAMNIVVNREKVGFEPEKEIKFVPNMLIAGRYQFIKELGDAAFSTAVQCLDIAENQMICIKVIKNNKDYFDQSIDEIKLLRYINANGNPDEKNFLRVYDYFYAQEHLMIVTELLKDNLYDFYKYINDKNLEYFSLKRIQIITKQILVCLEFIHKLKIIHCDLKPENILMKSITDSTVKVIDFGSSCFIHDHLSTYIQSRSYRAPEVIIGCKYDFKIDMWSLGCIITELYTGNVLFQNDSVQSMLARIMGICGPLPDWMFEKGKLVNDFYTKEKLLYMEPNENNSSVNQSIHHAHTKSKKIHILVPKRSNLKNRLRTDDEQFFDFCKKLLEIDPNLRLNATEALNHPWIKDIQYE